MSRWDEFKCVVFGHKLVPITEPGCVNVGYCVRKTGHEAAIFKLDPNKPATFQVKGEQQTLTWESTKE